MVDPDKQNPDELLDAYLDGTLTPDEQQWLEDRLREDPLLRQQLELSRRVDGALRVRFRPPAQTASWDVAAGEIKFPARIATGSQDRNGQSQPTERPAAEVATTHDSGRNRGRLVLWAVAASIMWLAVLWQLWPRNEARYTWRSLENIYATRVESGFQADWLCSDAREFATTFLERQQQPLLLRPMAAGRVMVGLAYIPGINEMTTTLMCLVDGEPVMVFVDRLQDDIRPDLEFAKAPPPGLHVFRKQLAGLAIYELTPWEAPGVIDALYVPAQLPPAGTPTVP